MCRVAFAFVLAFLATIFLGGCSDQSPTDQPPEDRVVWRVRADGTGDFTDIQDAVAVATGGDTIFVGPGRYAGLHGAVIGLIPRLAALIVDGGPVSATITILSEAGPESTIIGGEKETDYAVIFNNISSGRLSGFEIRGGGNKGVYLRNSSVTIEGSRITDATWGLHCDGGASIVRSSAFVGNEIGLYGVGATVTTDGNVFEGNRTSGIGLADGSVATLHADSLVGNGTAGASESAQLRLNVAEATADGLLIARGPADGALLITSSLNLTSSTIVDHPGGNGIRLKSGSTLTAERVIIAVTRGCAIDATGGVATLACCDIFGETAGAIGAGCALAIGGGNTYANPIFCNIGAGNYTLSARSPCAPANSGACGLIGVLGVTCD